MTSMSLSSPINAPARRDLDEILRPGAWGDWRHWDFDTGTDLDGWDVSGTGSVVSVGTNVDDQHPGLLAISTGSSASGYSTANRGAARLIAGGNLALGFDVLLKVSALSDGTDSYQIRVGFGDATAGGDHTDGIYWETTGGTSPTWQFKAANGGTRTTQASGVSVGTGWHRLTSIVAPNAAGTLTARFWIDKVLHATTITTNLPTGAAQFGSICSITKLLGTANRAAYIDYYTRMIRILKGSSPRNKEIL